MDTVAMIAFPAVSLVLGMLGGLITSKHIPTWYAKLIKPSFNPPNWIFGPVWTTLYIMIGVSGYLVWSKEKAFTHQHLLAWSIYFTQCFLNYMWTPLFFGMHALLPALIEIILLLISIVLNIYVFYGINPTAAYLLIPYLLWVSFATLLNYSLWNLNRDVSIDEQEKLK